MHLTPVGVAHACGALRLVGGRQNNVGVSLRERRDTTQVMLGVSLRARLDTTLDVNGEKLYIYGRITDGYPVF